MLIFFDFLLHYLIFFLHLVIIIVSFLHLLKQPVVLGFESGVDLFELLLS